MSDAEYEVLVAGGRLMNATDHAKEHGQLTDSIGFCFFTEAPDDTLALRLLLSRPLRHPRHP